MRTPRPLATLVAVALFTFAGAAAAQDSGPAARAPAEPAYTPEALRARVEGDVEVVVSVDETGRVVDASRSSPALGFGLDEAALEAARRTTFTPAVRGGLPVRAKAILTFTFKLPATPAAPGGARAGGPAPGPAAGAAGVSPPASPIQTGADQTTRVIEARPTSVASASASRDRDFRLRPIGSVQDILRVTPGLLVVQHAGGGKANQYLIRGFDADHGTDLALSLDGVPINMPSHGHGQGYADTHFVIPEVVDRVEISKGPYFVDQGDFATAGAIDLVTRRSFEHSALSLSFGGSPGHGGPLYRGVMVASPEMHPLKPLFAAEVGRSDGPFENPERFRRYKVFTKATLETARGTTLTAGLASYAGDWTGSGQLPRREVDAGRLDRFGTLDPTEGGASARHQAFVAARVKPAAGSELSGLAYAGLYRFDLFSNFTFFRDDPVRGDQIRQVDRRTFAGAQVKYQTTQTLRGIALRTTLGGSVRNDEIDNQLWHTQARGLLEQRRGARVHESSVAAFGQEEVVLTRHLRMLAGARADYFSFAVDDALPGGTAGGVQAASQLSPKLSGIFSPVRSEDGFWDLFVNYGHGFHSNDARGVVQASGAATPLTRAVGGEVGTRLHARGLPELAVAAWELRLDSETVWVGDEGTTEAAGASRRRGVDLEARMQLGESWAVDLDLTWASARFLDDARGATLVPLAPRQTWAGGLTYKPRKYGLRGALRFYGVGPRPANEDYSVRADGFTLVDLHLGYRHSRFDVAFDVENLLNHTYRSAQFATDSRVRGETGCANGSRAVSGDDGAFVGCRDLHFTPGYPLTMRLTGTVYLD